MSTYTAAMEIYWAKFIYSRIWRKVRCWSAYDFNMENHKKSLEKGVELKISPECKNSSGPRNKTILLPWSQEKADINLQVYPISANPPCSLPKKWRNKLMLLNFYSLFTAGIHMHCWKKNAILLTLRVLNTISYTKLLISLAFSC